MDVLRSLPFKVGHLVEMRSFVRGYRGAWFRCQIKKASKTGVDVEYCEFEEGITRMKYIYHKPHWERAKKQLMLRPQFPPVYRQGEAPDVNTLSEVIVVTNGVWKVGDLADWHCDGCYWSGTITELLGDDMVQFDLHPKPIGEGLSYQASCSDLRPSLEWSQQSGWTVPVPKGRSKPSNYCPCAWLVQPINQGKLKSKRKKHSEAAKESLKDSEVAQESPLELNASASCSSMHLLPSSHRLQSRENVPESQTGVVPLDARRTRGKKRDADALQSGVEKGNHSDSVSSTCVKASAEVPDETLCNEDAPEKGTLKRTKLSKNTPLNPSTCDPMLSLLVDMEELLTRVKWLRRFLEPPASETERWKFQEYRAGSSSAGHK